MTESHARAMMDIDACWPRGHFIPNKQTAISLLNRRWVKRVSGALEIDDRSLYVLTPRGHTVLRIMRNQNQRSQLQED